MKAVNQIKHYLSILLLFIGISFSLAQKKQIIYSNISTKIVKLSKSKKVKYFESDSLVLNQNNTFENYYKYFYFDEIGNSKTIGIYEINRKNIILHPKREFDSIVNGKEYGIGKELNNYITIYCKKINSKKIKCEKDYQVIKYLKQKN